MRFKDVNSIEADFVAILFGELVQGGNLPPKRRSGIAPEYQDDGLVCPKGRKIGRSVVFQLFDRVGAVSPTLKCPLRAGIQRVSNGSTK
jgi:hypothetical protein